MLSRGVPGRAGVRRRAPAGSISAAPGRSGYQRRPARREDDRAMSTRTLLILAALCGVAILAATAVQVLIAR
jgi:hypothetical protein